MQFKLTNNNIRLRYLLEKEKAFANGTKFTYADMAEMFDADDRTIYTWVTTVKALQHIPTTETRKNQLTSWLNDGILEYHTNLSRK